MFNSALSLTVLCPQLLSAVICAVVNWDFWVDVNTVVCVVSNAANCAVVNEDN